MVTSSAGIWFLVGGVACADHGRRGGDRLGGPAIGPWGAAMVGGGLVLGLVVARYVLSAVSVTASDDVVYRTVGLNQG